MSDFGWLWAFPGVGLIFGAWWVGRTLLGPKAGLWAALGAGALIGIGILSDRAVERAMRMRDDREQQERQDAIDRANNARSDALGDDPERLHDDGYRRD